MAYNLFLSNELISNVIKDILGKEKKEDYPFFTQDYFFTAFFYLTKRFGHPKVFDDYKQTGVWDFKVKGFTIRIEITSCLVEFMMFGKYQHSYIHKNSPFDVKSCRLMQNNPNILINIQDKEVDETQKILRDNLFGQFCTENNIDDSWTIERFKKEMSYKWHDYTKKYNFDVVKNLMSNNIKDKCYINSYLKYALKTLRQFLNNMLTPISVRDSYFNILGTCDYDNRYIDNIKIEYIKPSK